MNIDVNDSIKKAKELLKKEKTISSALKATIELLIFIITMLANRLNLNSSNSSKPPSTDLNRKRKQKTTGDNKPGGQFGHRGIRLEKVKNPDKIEILKVDRRKIPPGEYKEIGYESRQVIDIQIKKIVTEYRAQILEDSKGKKYTALFPKGITSNIQYGNTLKANSVYMSQFQLIPYNRIKDHFIEQMNIPISAGSIFNFNKEVYDLLKNFDEIAKKKLIHSLIVHTDETGININGKRKWLHLASNKLWTYFYPHEKRGTKAIDDIGIIPHFSGILCHDHWKPYYNYKCTHALCNAHHIRELERVIEQEDQKWAVEMKDFLIASNKEVIKAEGILSEKDVKDRGKEYDNILEKADRECPAPSKIARKRGRTKKSKARNLLERLINYKDDVLRFMENDQVPFTNNLGENDLRMTKVQQKISGCFRSMDGAYIFCRLRSYLSTCRKHDMTATNGLKILFEGGLPDFINDP